MSWVWLVKDWKRGGKFSVGMVELVWLVKFVMFLAEVGLVRLGWDGSN